MSIPNFSAFNLSLEPVPDFDGWFQGPVTHSEAGMSLAAQLRASSAATDHLVFVGALNDEGHRIYVTPPLSVREIVQDFGVGGHGGHSAESADREVGERLEAVQSICPFVVTFADSAGLHAEFTHPLNEATATKIDQVFTADEDTDFMACGLEGYLSEWMGEGALLAPTLMQEQALRLWWD